MERRWLLAATCILISTGAMASERGNRLAYLDTHCDPYYVNDLDARLTTPQWIGEADVQAVVVLAIDDMADPKKYEGFLRPILNRLKKIDGRAGVNIMTTKIDPNDPQLQTFLAEGVQIDPHTASHPCPCLQKGDLAAAKATFDKCIDLLARIPGNQPVGFRMPCCDSMNSVSPRFFAEIFNKTTPDGHFLRLDSSVFHLFTPNDPELPRNLVQDPDGREKFRKYIPRDRNMVNYVENYPYPYVIGRLCWEFPCLMPSDWDAQNLNGKCSEMTVRDMKAAIDATVVKQGVFALCFHPHGWIRNDQVVELIDYAVRRHGKKVKFLNFHEVEQRLTKNLLGGESLRTKRGNGNGVRVCDVNGDGYLDAIIANERVRQTRIWSPEKKMWQTIPFPVPLATPTGRRASDGGRFGILHPDGFASVLVSTDSVRGLWHFDGRKWTEVVGGLDGLSVAGKPLLTTQDGRDLGLRLRDLDLDGTCELIVGNSKEQAVFSFTGHRWRKLPFALPNGIAIVDSLGRDAGFRFVDVDEDGHDDIVFSNHDRYAVYLFSSMAEGWSRKMFDDKRRPARAAGRRELPMIVRADGTNNGAWFSYRHMWVQNEQTGAVLPHHVDDRSFANDLLQAE